MELYGIRELREYHMLKRIEEGYSGDEKYLLEKEGLKYLLRVGKKADAEKSRIEYDRLHLYENTDLYTHRPIVFGETKELFFSIVTWVEGTPVMDVIKRDVSSEHYELGKRAGMELKKLHELSKADYENNWAETIEEKYQWILGKLSTRGERVRGGREAIQYIESHRYLLRGRQQVLLHGDYHWNNVVVSEDGRVGIIDFSGAEQGDPWYEFCGMVWVLEYSAGFANGQLDGYFGVIPEAFWPVYKLYVALYALEHLAHQVKSNPEGGIRNAERMLRLFGEHYELEIPTFRR